MISALKRLPDNAFELTITVPLEKIKTAYEKVVEGIVKETEIDGFRKGKAPKDLVEKRLDKNKTYGIALEELLPEAYGGAVKEQNLSPIIEPRIEIVSMEEEKDWQIRAVSCEKPEIKLGDYKNKIAEITAKDKIWVPGKEKKEEKQDDSEQSKNKKLGVIIETLLKTCSVGLAEILVEREANHELARLLEEIKKLGLTLEQYLASTGKTAEELKKDYGDKAKGNLALEFILEAVADDLSVTVSDSDIEAEFSRASDEKTKENLKNNRYVLSMFLRRRKTLDKLQTL